MRRAIWRTVVAAAVVHAGGAEEAARRWRTGWTAAGRGAGGEVEPPAPMALPHPAASNPSATAPAPARGPRPLTARDMAAASAANLRPGSTGRCEFVGAVARPAREPQREPARGRVTAGLERAAHRLGEPAGDREPQPRARRAARGAAALE